MAEHGYNSHDAQEQRKLGLLAGQIMITDDFDDPLPDEIALAFGADDED